MDGKFTAEHQKMRHSERDVLLSDGLGFFVQDAPYKEHLAKATERRQVMVTSLVSPCL